MPGPQSVFVNKCTIVIALCSECDQDTDTGRHTYLYLPGDGHGLRELSINTRQNSLLELLFRKVHLV